MRSKYFTFLVLFAVCLLTIACPAPCDMEDGEINAVHAELAPVVQAIENFHAEKKVYPNSLAELVPKYLKEVPKKANARKFSYNKISNDEYKIRINSQDGGTYSGSCEYSEIEDRRKDSNDE